MSIRHKRMYSVSSPVTTEQWFVQYDNRTCELGISEPCNISRCLKRGGRFVSITFAQPFFRKRLYARTEYNWSVRHDSYGEGFEYFVYVMTKGEPLSPEDAALKQKLMEKPGFQPASSPALQEEEDNDFLSNIRL